MSRSHVHAPAAPAPRVRPSHPRRTTQADAASGPLAAAIAAVLAALLAAAVALLVAGCGGGGGDVFDQPVEVATDAVIADLDGDGRADLLTSAMFMTDTAFDGRLTLYRQLAPGQFSATATSVGQYPWTLTVGDVDGDGAPDVLAVDAGRHGSAEKLWWLRQDPAQRGRLLPPALLLEAPRIGRALLADFTGDGVPDIALAANALAAGEPGLTLLPQAANARGSFGTPATVPLPGRAVQIAAGDIDGDGRADLAVTVVTSPAGTLPPTDSLVALLRALPGGGFAPPVTLAPANGLNATRQMLGDIDGDGRVDLLRYATPCCAPPAVITAALQGAAGQFTATATPLAGVQGIDDAAFADFDGDGRVDAAVTGFFPVGAPTTVQARLNLFRQGLGGTFALNATLDLAPQPSRAAAGDVDGDGRPDLVLLDGNAAWLLLNQPAQPGSFGPPRRLP